MLARGPTLPEDVRAAGVALKDICLSRDGVLCLGFYVGPISAGILQGYRFILYLIFFFNYSMFILYLVFKSATFFMFANKMIYIREHKVIDYANHIGPLI